MSTPDDPTNCATREIYLGEGNTLNIKEFTLLQDDAGAVVWDSGLVLAYYLAHQEAQGNTLVRGRTCLELGSGTGVVGLSAARLGAAHVYLSDLPHLVPYLRENIQANGLGASCSALPLQWGNPEHLASAQASELLRPPDAVLASDVLYTAETRSAFVATLASVLAPEPAPAPAPSRDPAPEPVEAGPVAPGGVEGSGRGEVQGGGGADSAGHGGSLALLSYEQRPGVEELPALCAAHGLWAQEVHASELHPDWRSPDIHVLRIRKRAPQPSEPR